jgi:hypothetical protein
MPYGYAFTVRLEVPAVVAGMTLDSLHERTEDICNLAWPIGYQKAEEHDKLLMRTTVESVLDAISHL